MLIIAVKASSLSPLSSHTRVYGLKQAPAHEVFGGGVLVELRPDLIATNAPATRCCAVEVGLLSWSYLPNALTHLPASSPGQCSLTSCTCLHRRVSQSFPSVAAFASPSPNKDFSSRPTQSRSPGRRHQPAPATIIGDDLFLLSFWYPTKGHFLVPCDRLWQHIGLVASPIDNRSAGCA